MFLEVFLERQNMGYMGNGYYRCYGKLPIIPIAPITLNIKIKKISTETKILLENIVFLWYVRVLCTHRAEM